MAHHTSRSLLYRFNTWITTSLFDFLHTYHLKYKLANSVCGFIPFFISGSLRRRLYRLAGFNIAPGVQIVGNLELISTLEGFYKKLVIGQDTFIGYHTTINLDAPVHVGKGVSIGPYVSIYTGTHQIGPGSNRRMPDVLSKPVILEDECWIGLGAIILPGVTVGHHSIIAARAIVDQDVPPASRVEGNPARIVQRICLDDS